MMTRRDVVVGTAAATTIASPAAAGPGLDAIRNLDYVVIFARDMPAMRKFYETVMRFPLQRELSPTWIEYRIGGSLLALTRRGMLFDDPPPPEGAASVQLAFRVLPEQVDLAARELEAAGVAIVSEPTDRPWGHRTLFFRDPDGNIMELYADI